MSGAQFGQQYSQAGVQQMGTPGVNGQQLQNKTALSNNLPQFSTELKGAGSVPNMVSVKPSICCIYYWEVVSGLSHLQPSVTIISVYSRGLKLNLSGGLLESQWGWATGAFPQEKLCLKHSNLFKCLIFFFLTQNKMKEKLKN